MMASLAPTAGFAAPPRQVVVSVPTATALLSGSPNPLHEPLERKGLLRISKNAKKGEVEVLTVHCNTLHNCS